MYQNKTTHRLLCIILQSLPISWFSQNNPKVLCIPVDPRAGFGDELWACQMDDLPDTRQYHWMFQILHFLQFFLQMSVRLSVSIRAATPQFFLHLLFWSPPYWLFTWRKETGDRGRFYPIPNPESRPEVFKIPRRLLHGTDERQQRANQISANYRTNQSQCLSHGDAKQRREKKRLPIWWTAIILGSPRLFRLSNGLTAWYAGLRICEWFTGLVSIVCARTACMTQRETGDLGWKDVLLAKEKMLFPSHDQIYPRTISRFKFS